MWLHHPYPTVFHSVHIGCKIAGGDMLKEGGNCEAALIPCHDTWNQQWDRKLKFSTINTKDKGKQPRGEICSEHGKLLWRREHAAFEIGGLPCRSSVTSPPCLRCCPKPLSPSNEAPPRHHLLLSHQRRRSIHAAPPTCCCREELPPELKPIVEVVKGWDRVATVDTEVLPMLHCFKFCCQGKSPRCCLWTLPLARVVEFCCLL